MIKITLQTKRGERTLDASIEAINKIYGNVDNFCEVFADIMKESLKAQQPVNLEAEQLVALKNRLIVNELSEPINEFLCRYRKVISTDDLVAFVKTLAEKR